MGLIWLKDYKHVKKSVKAGDKMKIDMALGGRWVARIKPL